MDDLTDVITALERVVAATENVVDELKEANRELGGWYDDSKEPPQFHEGIGLRVYGIELKMDQACEHLDRIARELKFPISDNILDEIRAIRNEVKSGYNQAQSSQTQSSHLSGLYFLVIVGLVVIVGTLRHWF
jgi:hypothetical protein